MVQGLGLCAFTAEGPGSIPGWGTKILQAAWCSQKKKKKSNCTVRETEACSRPIQLISGSWVLC